MTARRRCLDCFRDIDYRATRCGSHAQRARNKALRRADGWLNCATCGGAFKPADGRGISARCPRCVGRSALVWCALDGAALDGHPRCRACTALCGTAHTQVMTVGGVCDACIRHFGRAALSRVDWGEVA